MTPFKIYQKTMVFNWFKLGLGLLTLLICAIILGGTWFVINNFGLDLTTTIGASCGAFLVAVAIYYFIMCKQGYSIKIGHLEVIEYALKNDAVPPNQLEYSKKVVTERFGSNGKYYMFSRSLTVATSQISRVISRGFSLESEAPNLKASSKVIRLISLPALNLMDECCMAYALRNKDYEVNAACVDALTILTQNLPRFLRNALFASIRIYLFVLIVATVFFIPGSPSPWTAGKNHRLNPQSRLSRKSVYSQSAARSRILSENPFYDRQSPSGTGRYRAPSSHTEHPG